jgi:hypothetical protein
MEQRTSFTGRPVEFFMTTGKRWPAQAYLDGLRLDAGWSVGTAILASYSADLLAIAAVLLALAGRDDERGSGSCADLAESVEALRGRVRILIQRGRLAKLKRLPAVAGILDQFVVEVPFDERERSWHPKLALLRLTGPNGETAWRFWLGSRNITSGENLDFGLLISGKSGASARGNFVEGIERVATRLAERAAIPNLSATAFGKQVSLVRWTSPAGIHVKRIHLTSGDGTEPALVPPTRAEDIVLISPFLDGGFVGSVGKWGNANCRRTLMSNHTELQKLAGQSAHPISGYGERILAFDAPPPDAVEAAPRAIDSVGDSVVEAGAEELPLGLHAKILAVKTGAKLKMWVGSANATRRAWSGRNVEIIAELEAAAEFQGGLDHMLGMGQPVTESALTAEPPEEVDTTRDRLDRAREHVAAHWDGRLDRANDNITLWASVAPDPPDVDLVLEAGLATADLFVWPRGATRLDLGAYPLSLHTEFVQLRLSFEGYECSWLQRCPAVPPIDERRDRAALAKHLGPRAFLDWLRALLQGDVAGGDEASDAWDGKAARGKRHADDLGLAFQQLTLEDMLSCWARDAKAFVRADERLSTYVEQVIAEADDLTVEDRDRLTSLHDVWSTLRSELLKRS